MKPANWIQLAALATIVLACQSDKPVVVEAEDDPIVVRSMMVKKEPVLLTVTAVGSAESFARATLGTKLLGRVADVRVKEGDTVRKGDLLVRIEDRDLAAKRQQALSAVSEAKAVFENARGNAVRIRNLYQEKAVSKQRLDEVEMGLSRAEAGVSAAQGALDEVEANLGYSSVHSPITGVVVAKFVQPGDMAAPGAPLVSVEQQDPMKVTVEVGEQDLAFVRVNSAVKAEIDAVGEGRRSRTELLGRVDAIVPSSDPSSRTFEVKVLIDNKDGAIRSGMFARVYFPKGEREGVLIPASAVVREGQLEGVFVIRDGRARLRWLRLGRTYPTGVEVISGLSAEDRIVLSKDEVVDGARVEVK